MLCSLHRYILVVVVTCYILPRQLYIHMSTRLLLLCHQHARNTKDLNRCTHERILKFKNKTHLVRKGATDGTKADEEATAVTRRTAWNFMVVIFCIVIVLADGGRC